MYSTSPADWAIHQMKSGVKEEREKKKRKKIENFDGIKRGEKKRIRQERKRRR